MEIFFISEDQVRQSIEILAIKAARLMYREAHLDQP